MKKPVKSPQFAFLRKAFLLARRADQLQTSAAEVTQQQQEFSPSRRKFLETSGKTILVGSMAPQLLFPSLGKRAPRIAIIGGGIAGLNALYTLKKAGLEATVYEASARTGGRMFTVKGVMGEGTWTEFGGEFIDTQHLEIHRLADEFGLEMIDTSAPSETKLAKEAFFFNNQHYSLEQVVEAFRGFAGRMQADIDKLPDDISYRTQDPATIRFDRMNISEYLESIGVSGWMKSLLEQAYEAEYGLSPQEQSAINLLYLISTDTEGGHFDIFGESDERYKVKGGNQSIPDAIAAKYPGNIQLNRSLEMIERKFTHFRLKFSGMSEEVKADYVIMTIPFSKLREVDVRVNLPKVKKDCIQSLGFGTNSKVMMSFNRHFWRERGYLGFTYSDNGIQTGWDNAQLQTPDGQAAGYSILLGGPAGVDAGKGGPEVQHAKYFPKIEQVFPGAAQHYAGKTVVMDWPSHPFTKGSYLCYRPGQYTSIAGAEAEPVGQLLFAGEHCGGYFAGFMNGGALSGRKAAEVILKSVFH
jgi:monoamine oxidase